MSRYLMANRRAGKFREDEKLASRRALDATLNQLSAGIDVIHDHQPERETARRVVLFEAAPGEIEARSQGLPHDVVVEPEILHWNEPAYPADFAGLQKTSQAALAPLGTGADLTVKVVGSGSPLKGAEVILFLRGLGGMQNRQSAVTDAKGRVGFSFSEFWEPSALLVIPAGDFWPLVVRGPAGTVTVECPPLPRSGPTEWWHEILGAAPHDAGRGQGIRVGVADSGIGPHPCLAHAHNVGAFIDADFDPDGGADIDSHGSHVCGTIGAVPQEDGQFAGIAPAAELFSVRVFPPDNGANQGDIANAIDALSRDHEVDLINLSLGSPTGSQIELDTIIDAFERGTLCICAAANSSGPVEFPAAFKETVAVAALGRLGWGPPGTMPTFRLPQEAEKFAAAGLFLANFSCFGPELDCGGPGAGIISTVPARHGLTAPYASMGGTSMASPAVCGALAAILSTHGVYKTLPRDSTRASLARSVLRQRCRDIDLAKEYQGFGLPSLR